MPERIKYSIIIPSYNQDRFIEQTFKNISELKESAKEIDIDIEVLLFDNESNEATQKLIQAYKSLFDYIEIKKDKGQYDAINKGIAKITGHYWTWLNTDDLIEIEGFLKLAELLKNLTCDYIYGSIILIDEESKPLRIAYSTMLNTESLVNNSPGIYQPGSFFRKEFTDKIGLLAPYECCFDYEYILRILKKNGNLHRCDFPLAKFRLHKSSKTKNRTIKFVKEQLAISKLYGRKPLSWLAFIAFLRQIKHGLNKTS
jgi:glycosyltransferase involved in cell wall biosynthesis